MPRFVVLEHDHPTLHWDLMLEAGDKLRTWRLAQPPEKEAGPIPATALGDHRKMYLDYEGPVSGGRGSVVRWDSGEFACADAAAEPHLEMILFHGSRLHGCWLLQHLDGADWQFACADGKNL